MASVVNLPKELEFDRTAAPPADPEALIEEARSRQRRRRVWLGLAAIVLAACTGGVYGLVGVVGGPGLTATAVEHNLSASLANTHGLIVHSEVRYQAAPRERVETWADPATDRVHFLSTHDAARQTAFVMRFVAASATSFRVARTVVAYSERGWWTTHPSRAQRGPLTPNMVCGQCDPFQPSSAGHYRVSLVGEQTIDRQPAFLLRGVTSPSIATAGATTVDLWVARSTFLPLRETLSANSRQLKTASYSWLPRTAANLALVKLRIPAGFKHLASQ